MEHNEHKEYSDKLRAKFITTKEIVGRRLTLTAMAKEIGCSISLLSKWVKGEKMPNMHTLYQIAEIVVREQALLKMKTEELDKMLED